MDAMAGIEPASGRLGDDRLSSSMAMEGQVGFEPTSYGITTRDLRPIETTDPWRLAEHSKPRP